MNQPYSYHLLKNRTFGSQIFFHNNPSDCANHYDTLKLSRNCSEKEIRNAFIKLSKKHHPDVNKHPKAHSDFLQIREAYKILSKPASRELYDLTLNHSHKFINVNANYQQNGEKNHHPADDPFFYVNRDKTKDAHNAKQPYYGIKGLRRVSNGLIALLCVGVAVTAFTIQMTIIRFTVAHQHNRIQKRSQETQQLLNEVKEQADRNGNMLQLELLSKRSEDEQKEVFNLNKIN